MCNFLSSVLKRRVGGGALLPFFLPADKNAMARTGTAILDHKVNLRMEAMNVIITRQKHESLRTRGSRASTSGLCTIKLVYATVNMFLSVI